jgi:tetratricopeptide (TPR) repeat protein
MFEELSVFTGGWTLDGAVAICRNAFARHNQLTALDRLTRLVDASLVSVEERDGTVRYHQLETLRAYGAERLEARHAADDVRSRHASYYLDLAEELESRADGVDHASWLRHVESEYDNLRGALTWLSEHNAVGALRLAVAISRYWYLRGFVSEGCGWLENLLIRVTEHDARWGAGSIALGDLLILRNDYSRARHYALMSLDVMRAVGNLGGTARAATFLGMRALEVDDFGQARALCYTGLATARQAGDTRTVLTALDNLGLIEIAEHNLPEARRRFEDRLTVARSTGYPFAEVSSMGRLGVIARLEGDYTQARIMITQGVAAAKRFGHRPALGSHTTSLGNLARCEGNYAEARRLLLESLDLGQHDIGLSFVLVNAVASLGVLAVAEKAYADGVRFLSAVASAGAPHGTVQVPELRYDIEAALGSARQVLSASAYEAAWSQAQAWSLDEAVRQARSAMAPTPRVAQAPGSDPTGVAANLTVRQREVARLVFGPDEPSDRRSAGYH